MNKFETTLEDLENYCNFEEGFCYMFMLLPRKKENNRNTEKDKLGLCQRRIVRSNEEISESLEYFKDFASRYPEIVFRVYISVEKRDLSKALFAIQNELNNMVKDLYYGNKEVYDRTVNLSSTLKTVLARPNCRGEKLFHFDIDWTHDELNKFQALYNAVLFCSNKIHYFGKTLNGWTMVCECFNPNDLKEYFPDAKGMNVVKDLVEIKTNSMLYVGVYNHPG